MDCSHSMTSSGNVNTTTRPGRPNLCGRPGPLLVRSARECALAIPAEYYLKRIHDVQICFKYVAAAGLARGMHGTGGKLTSPPAIRRMRMRPGRFRAPTECIRATGDSAGPLC